MAEDKPLKTKRKSAGKNPALAPGLAGIGKKQPQAVELEEAVLGACMLELSAVNAVVDILEPQAFYKEAHGSIFKAIKDLFGDSEPIDLLTVTERLRKEGVLGFCGGPAMWPVSPTGWRAPPTWSPTPALLPRSSSTRAHPHLEPDH